MQDQTPRSTKGQPITAKKVIGNIIYLTVATFIIATAIFFFLVPSRAAVSSITGLAIVLTHWLPFSVAQITLGLNAGLLVIGFILFGREFGGKTVYTSLLLPLFLRFYEVLLPNNTSLTGDATLDVACYIFVVSIGLGMLFNDNASSGGLDIVAKILQRFLHMEIGQALSLAGIVIALSSAFVYDAKTVALSLLGTYLNGLVLDHYIFGQTGKKRVCIMTSQEEVVRRFILQDLRSGATIYEAIGGFDLQPRREIITIVNKQEYQQLMTFLEKTDPQAFVTIYNVTEVRYVPKPKLMQ